MTGFLIWAAVGCLLIGIGIRAFFAGKPVGFWAGTAAEKVNDTRGYNRATGRLFIVYGTIFILLGLPLLGSQKAFILLSVSGVVFETIAVMAVYSLRIMKKYGADR